MQDLQCCFKSTAQNEDFQRVNLSTLRKNELTKRGREKPF